MYTLAELAKTIQTVLGATADQLAKTTGFIKRQRQLTGAKLVRALTPGFLPKPAATLEELTPSGVLNEVEISPQGLDKRFTEEAATFSFNSLIGSSLNDDTNLTGIFITVKPM